MILNNINSKDTLQNLLVEDAIIIKSDDTINQCKVEKIFAPASMDVARSYVANMRDNKQNIIDVTADDAGRFLSVSSSGEYILSIIQPTTGGDSNE